MTRRTPAARIEARIARASAEDQRRAEFERDRQAFFGSSVFAGPPANRMARRSGRKSHNSERMLEQGFGLMYCPNCDRHHEVRSDRDYLYTKIWRQRMLSLYPGQAI